MAFGLIEGYVERGERITTGQVKSNEYVQRSYPYANVTVYLANTATLADLYGDSTGAVPKSNPFQASSTGYYWFYGTDGDYDIKFTGVGILLPWIRKGVQNTRVLAAGGVQSIYGRIGDVVAMQSDYDGFFLTPAEGDALYKPIGYTAPVDSVAGRTGAVTLAVADVSGAAPLASPTFTGDPKAPTPAVGDNDTSIATTKFVKDQNYITSAGAPVQSVFGRVGAVAALQADYDAFFLTPAEGNAAYLALTGGTLTGSLTGTSMLASSFSLRGQKFQTFCFFIYNDAGTIKHKFGADTGGSATLGNFCDMITGASAAAYTNTPTVDAVTPFAAGAGIMSTVSNVILFDVAEQTTAGDFDLIATEEYNNTGIAFKTQTRRISHNVNGVTLNRTALGFSNATTGASLPVTSIPVGKVLVIRVRGHIK
jgi:hypothetical protein